MLFEAVLEVVGLLGNSALLVLDDAHWADSTTHQLLLHCTTRTPSRPLAVVITWRPGVEDSALRAFERLESARSLRLRPLSAADVARLEADVLGATPSPELVVTITERSAGNPFAATELFSSEARPTSRGLPTGTATPATIHRQGITHTFKAHPFGACRMATGVRGVAFGNGVIGLLRWAARP